MLEELTHQEEHDAWIKDGEFDLCQDCGHYYDGTDHCLLKFFQQDEKEGERFPTIDCVYFSPREEA